MTFLPFSYFFPDLEHDHLEHDHNLKHNPDRDGKRDHDPDHFCFFPRII